MGDKEKLGFEQDIANMIYSFDAGVLSVEDLENLLKSERKKNAYTIQMTGIISQEMEKLFTLYEKMTECFIKKV